MCVNVICMAFDIQQPSECISLTSAQHAFMHTYDFQIALYSATMDAIMKIMAFKGALKPTHLQSSR